MESKSGLLVLEILPHMLTEESRRQGNGDGYKHGKKAIPSSKLHKRRNKRKPKTGYAKEFGYEIMRSPQQEWSTEASYDSVRRRPNIVQVKTNSTKAKRYSLHDLYDGLADFFWDTEDGREEQKPRKRTDPFYVSIVNHASKLDMQINAGPGTSGSSSRAMPRLVQKRNFSKDQ